MADLKIDPEEGVISALMVEPQAVEKICGMLSPEMFSDAILGRIYYEYVRAYDNNRELTLGELQQALGNEYMPFQVEETLSRCLDSRLTSADIEGSARAVLSKYKKESVTKLLNNTSISETEVDDQIENLIRDLEGLRSGDTSNGKTVAEITKEYSDNYFCDKDNSLILLGERGIDNLTGGFQGGDLAILAARPSVGKSALASQWAWEFAKQGLKVGYYNLEMQEAACFERFIAAKTGISVTRIRLAKAFLNDEEEKYRRAVNELLKQDKIVIFTGAKKVSEIRNDMRTYHFDLIIIDYLQLLVVGNRYHGNKVAEVGELSLELKRLAMDFQIPVLALSQLNRASEGRATKEPMLSDIRDSGNIEQDASIVFFVWNKNEDDLSEKGFKTAKSRSGTVGRYDLIFDGSSMSFRSEHDYTPFDEM